MNSHLNEHQKTLCHEKIAFHRQNVCLQSAVSILCILWGLHAAQRQSILVPLIAAPSAAASLTKLVTHETKRRQYKNQLKELENN